MREISGKPVSRGIAKGRIVFAGEGNTLNMPPDGAKRWADDPAAELGAFYAARNQTMEELKKLYEITLEKCGEKEAMIFRAHSLLLEDKGLEDAVKEHIFSDGMSALYSLYLARERYILMLSSLDDDYMKTRREDIKSVTDQMLARLDPDLKADRGKHTYGTDERIILVGDDIAPGLFMSMERDCVAGLAAHMGSELSHTAVLAKTLGVPALVQVDLSGLKQGEEAVIDGINGRLIVEPDVQALDDYNRLFEAEKKRFSQLEAVRGLEDRTLSGQEMRVLANVGDFKDLRLAFENDASGIGLLRTECLFFEEQRLPDEETQLEMYKKMLVASGRKSFCIRTLDIGSDKQLGYLRTEREDNPALGIRGIRFCLLNEEIFLTQLRAILRAAAVRRFKVMYPMITDVSEWDEIQRLMERARQQLEERGCVYGEVDQGIMIETPAAALISSELARRADFFSIGTNDLSQYTLALDRNEAGLDRYYRADHPALEMLIRMVVESAKREGIPVSVCGETATKKNLLEFYLKLGVDEVSVSPSMILEVRSIIRKTA